MLQTFFFVAVLLLFGASSPSACTWPVPSPECSTIQAGIDSASVGDTVLVAAGTYTGAGNKNLDFGGVDLVLLSEAGPELTIIDCDGSGRGFYFHSGETDAAVVDGFMVTNGDAGFAGGGMYCQSSSPTIVDCSFAGNTASDGGGMYLVSESSPAVIGCSFTGNTATSTGGGVFCDESSPSVRNCTFSGNVAGSPGSETGEGGGMICVQSSPTVTRCSFAGNEAVQAGGGVYCFSSSATFDSCCFSGNAAYVGGGMTMDWWSSPTISNCTFSGNSASVAGGGVFLTVYSHSLIGNTIIAFSSSSEAVSCGQGSGVTLSCCDIFGNANGDYVGCIAAQLGVNGNFSTCPSFCFSDRGDFRLCDESPCAPGNHPEGYDCGLIGAWDVGCRCGPSKAEGTTWGAMKAMYR